MVGACTIVSARRKRSSASWYLPASKRSSPSRAILRASSFVASSGFTVSAGFDVSAGGGVGGSSAAAENADRRTARPIVTRGARRMRPADYHPKREFVELDDPEGDE